MPESQEGLKQSVWLNMTPVMQCATPESQEGLKRRGCRGRGPHRCFCPESQEGLKQHQCKLTTVLCVPQVPESQEGLKPAAEGHVYALPKSESQEGLKQDECCHSAGMYGHGVQNLKKG